MFAYLVFLLIKCTRCSIWSTVCFVFLSLYFSRKLILVYSLYTVHTLENFSASKVALEMSSFSVGLNRAISLTRPNKTSVWSVLSWASSIIITLYTWEIIKSRCNTPMTAEAHVQQIAGGRGGGRGRGWDNLLGLYSSHFQRVD